MVKKKEKEMKSQSNSFLEEKSENVSQYFVSVHRSISGTRPLFEAPKVNK